MEADEPLLASYSVESEDAWGTLQWSEPVRPTLRSGDSIILFDLAFRASDSECWGQARLVGELGPAGPRFVRTYHDGVCM